MADGMTVHERYNDAEADIELLSEEGVTFRVHSYYLKAGSGALRDALSIPNIGSQADKIAIDINGATDAVACLLDAFTLEKMPDAPDIDLIVRTVALTHRYECPLARERLLMQAFYVVARSPWKCFVLFAQEDHLFFARGALSHFDREPTINKLSPTSIPLDLASQLPLPYLLGLTKVCSPSPRQFIIGIWTDRASDFTPVTS